jgi:hypothetical protein
MNNSAINDKKQRLIYTFSGVVQIPFLSLQTDLGLSDRIEQSKIIF